jgi:hypothetical protein
MGPGDPQRDDYYRRLDEDRFLDSTRSRRDPYPDDYYGQDSITDPATATALGWSTDLHIAEDDTKSLRVRLIFAVQNMRGHTGKAIVTFGYFSEDGLVAHEESFTPNSDDSEFKMEYLIPFKELYGGMTNLRGRLTIYDEAGQILGKSEEYDLDPYSGYPRSPDVAEDYPDD